MEFKEQPNTEKELLNILNPLVKKWFFSKFKSFSLPQLFGVMEIHSRNNILVSAPTGATKTLTGFLSILNELIDSQKVLPKLSNPFLNDTLHLIFNIIKLRIHHLNYDFCPLVTGHVDKCYAFSIMIGNPLDLTTSSREIFKLKSFTNDSLK